MSAVSPLLEDQIAATIFTQSLIKHEHGHLIYLESIVCGDVPTMITMLDLYPPEYWTNTSSTSSSDEAILNAAFLAQGVSSNEKGQTHMRMAWKRAFPIRLGDQETCRAVRISSHECASLLHQVYRKMFQNENFTSLFSNVSFEAMRSHSLLHFHRVSFATFICLARTRVETDWVKTMDVLLDLIFNDSTVIMGGNYIQEFCVHLHLMDVYSVDTLKSHLLLLLSKLAALLNGWTCQRWSVLR